LAIRLHAWLNVDEEPIRWYLHTRGGAFRGRRHAERNTGSNVGEDANLRSIERFIGGHWITCVDVSEGNGNDGANDTNYEEQGYSPLAHRSHDPATTPRGNCLTDS
jgi:hypothetical protein